MIIGFVLGFYALALVVVLVALWQVRSWRELDQSVGNAADLIDGLLRQDRELTPPQPDVDLNQIFGRPGAQCRTRPCLRDAHWDDNWSD